MHWLCASVHQPDPEPVHSGHLVKWGQFSGKSKNFTKSSGRIFLKYLKSTPSKIQWQRSKRKIAGPHKALLRFLSHLLKTGPLVVMIPTTSPAPTQAWWSPRVASSGTACCACRSRSLRLFGGVRDTELLVGVPRVGRASIQDRE